MKRGFAKAATALFLIAAAQLMLSCAAGPLRRGSAAFFSTPPPGTCAGILENSENLPGNPLLVYARGAWCPMCRQMDRVLASPRSDEALTKKTYLIVLDLQDGTLKTKEGPVPGSIFPPPKNSSLVELEKSRSWKRVLTCSLPSERFLDWSKEKRIPIVAGIDEKGKTVERIVGFHPDVMEELNDLILVVHGKVKLREDTASSPD